MPIVIGDALGSDFNNPLGLLADCHRRIENFLKVLHTVTRQACGRHLTDEHRHALEASLRYFRDAAPKHTADEENSVFPRLLSRASPHLAAFSAILGSLKVEHRMINDHHDQVEEVGRLWLVNNLLSTGELSRLNASLNDLRVIYSRHIAIEEQKVFPLAAQMLDRGDLKSIASEMAQRRNLTIKHNFVVPS
jgi:hemerythrin-like domain-containing protein